MKRLALLSAILALSVIAAVSLNGCGTAQMTLAQGLAWERWQKCRDVGATVSLREIRPDGQVWVTYRGGSKDAGDWQECMRRAAEDQARRVAVAPPAAPSAATAPPVGTATRSSLTAPSATTASAGPTAYPPIWEIGDRWVRSDGVLEVVAKDATGFRLRLGHTKEYRLTPDWALRQTVVNGIPVVEYTPPFPLVLFPLAVGNSWIYRGNLLNRLTGFNGPVQQTLRVDAFEEIALSAGVLKAFRIETGTGTHWYSPEARTIVRLVPRQRHNPLLEQFELVALPGKQTAGSPPAPDAPGRLEAATPSGVGALRPRDIARLTFPSVVLLVLGDRNGAPLGQGSGFFVAEDLVVTSYHVIEGGWRGVAKIVYEPQIYEVAGVVAADRERDLAVLKIRGAKAPALELETKGVAVGDEIYVAGNPQGFEGTFSAGIISAVRKDGQLRLLQISAPISAGSSGGPVLNSAGRVVGVVVITWRDSQNLNFAIDVVEVLSLLRRVGPLSPFPIAGPR